MRVAVIQFPAKPLKLDNLRLVLNVLDSIDADLVVFPEYLMGIPENGLNRDFVLKQAEPIDGEFTVKIAEKSHEKGLAVVFTLYLREGNAVYNAAALVDRGAIKALYRKIHLFDAFGYRESILFAAGSQLALAKVNDLTVGLAVCFDLRFPELFRAMSLRGVELFAVPAAWYRGPYKLEQWRVLTSARAHENTAYLVAANQSGKLFTGHSLAVNPMGVIQSELDEGEGVFMVDFDASLVKESRETIPVLKLVKNKLYTDWYRDISA
ncbi:MAG: carbon-nitrogen hydrolase family protein [Thermofilaceae archaeon]